MLIKEYRIPMPMSVEEYRIAQLYMIQVRAPPSQDAGKEGLHLWGGGGHAGEGVQRSGGRVLSCRPDGAPCARGLDPV